MKMCLFFSLLFYTASGFAMNLTCDDVVVDGVAQVDARAEVDVDNDILQVVDSSGEQNALSKELVYAFIEAPPVWFNRANECTVNTSKLPDNSKKSEFACRNYHDVRGPKIDMIAVFEAAADKSSGKYYGTVSYPDHSTSFKFSLEFKNCKPGL